MTKTLKPVHTTSAKENVSDIMRYGKTDAWKLLCKATSDAEGWMKSTKVMPLSSGCLVQVTTKQVNPDGSHAVAEAVTFVPNAKLSDFFQ